MIAAIAKGGEVKLVDDITLTEPLKITNEVTVYLNGKTLENTTIADNTCNVFRVNTGGVLTIKGEGNVEVNAESGYADVVRVLGGELNIYGGNFSHTAKPNEGADLIYVNTGTVNVYGGSFFKFDPAKNSCEGQNTDFVATGYKSSRSDDTFTVEAE